MREIILDTETTGLDPSRGDRLVEIGCVELVNRFLTGKVFHRYLNPERSMPLEAFAVHGLSETFLADKPKFAEVADEFLEFIGNDVLVIHNASFDTGFLNAELRRLKKPLIAPDRVLDTLQIARRKHPGQANSLDALCSRYGISNGHRTKHGALLDAEILAEVYAELTGGKQSSLILVDDQGSVTRSDTDSDGSETDTPQVAVRPNMSAKTVVSAEDMKAHALFVKSLGEKAIWKDYFEAESKGG